MKGEGREVAEDRRGCTRETTRCHRLVVERREGWHGIVGKEDPLFILEIQKFTIVYF